MDNEGDRDDGPAVGLCRSCAHARVITSDTGSVFYLCRRSAVDPTFPRYPRLPVLSCRGYEPSPGSSGGAERA